MRALASRTDSGEAAEPSEPPARPALKMLKHPGPFSLSTLSLWVISSYPLALNIYVLTTSQFIPSVLTSPVNCHHIHPATYPTSPLTCLQDLEVEVNRDCPQTRPSPISPSSENGTKPDPVAQAQRLGVVL